MRNISRRTSVRPTLRGNWSRPVSGILAVNGLALTGLVVILFSVQPGSTMVAKGSVAGQTVIAARQVTYPDTSATAQRRKQAMASVPVVYAVNTGPARERRLQASAFLSEASRVFSRRTSSTQRASRLRKLLPTDLSPEPLQQFFTLPAASLPVVRQRSLGLLSQAQAWRFAANEVPTTALALLSSIPARVSMPQRTAIGEMISTFLTPTEVPNIAATAAKRRLVASRVGQLYSTLYPGQVIVRRGDIVTTNVEEQLAALGLQGHATTWQDVAAAFVFTAAIVAMLLWYLAAFQASIVSNFRLLLLMDAGIVVTVAATRLLTQGHVLLPLLLPLAAIPTFAALLIAPEACIALALAMALLAGWVVANSFELTAYYFLTGAGGVMAIRHARQLKQFIIAGVCIALFSLAVLLAFGFAGASYDFSAVQQDILSAAFNGLISAILALGGFALLAGYFGVTTSLQLFELTQPQQPLLRRLVARATGTYNHSLVVANMVETAAEEIGANSLVAKVAALYHDIGKTANPQCYVENQLGMANVHDDLTAVESARIIRGHIPQGLHLAHEFHLPRPIIDAISEHHGTMTLAYFLQKATQQADDEPIDMSIFTYPGPKPQSKETALLMLADGCESAVRAGKDHSQAGIRDSIGHIVQERIAQGQLAECPLTLRDLERVQASFASVLNGLYHPRIEYPDTSQVPQVVAQSKPVVTIPSATAPEPRA